SAKDPRMILVQQEERYMKAAPLDCHMRLTKPGKEDAQVPDPNLPPKNIPAGILRSRHFLL
ncbi:MAG: hypothetical protein SOW60_00935, partial [Bacteroidaceae bacterium]|nr:hypothetical protein [Bacteroidaceae bacterium]